MPVVLSNKIKLNTERAKKRRGWSIASILKKWQGHGTIVYLPVALD
jgi:hypothetical protein